MRWLVIITDHAAQRFVERSTLNVENKSKARKTILKIFQKALKASVKERSELIKVIDCKYAKADFYMFQNIGFVVSDGSPSKKLLTVFRIRRKGGKFIIVS